MKRLRFNDGLLMVCTTSTLRKGGGRPPLGRLAGSGLLHHLVYLLERETLCLRNQEVGVDEGASAQASPDEEDGRLQVSTLLTNHVRGDDSNNGVPEPVGGSGQANATRSDGKRENLANDDPSARSPGGSKPEDEDGDESNLGIDRRDVVGDAVGGVGRVGVRVVETNSDTDNGNQELADQHAKRTDDQDGSATESFDGPERERRGANVDESEDQRDQESVANGASRLEERGGVVEDEVDTSPLLHHLKRSTQDGSAKVGLGTEHAALETVGPATEPGGGGNESALVFLIGNDFGNLSLDVLGVGGLAANARQSVDGLLNLTLLDEVSWRIGQEEQANSKDQSPGELNSDGDAVCSRVIEVLGGIDNNRRQHDTNRDAELVAGNKSATNFARALQEFAR